MNILLSAAAGSVASNIIDNTPLMPSIYKKSNKLLGVDIFTVEDQEKEDEVVEQDDNYVIDPDVGYLPKPKPQKLGYSLRGKGGPPKTEVKQEPIKEEPIKEEVIENDDTYELRPLDYVAYLSVTILVLYTSYKVLDLASKTNFDDIENIFNN